MDTNLLRADNLQLWLRNDFIDQALAVNVILAEWPEWWKWELVISNHCAKRMQDRGFNETDVRTMLQEASCLMLQEHGTYLAETSHDGRPWEVVISPDFRDCKTVVVTAYPVPTS